MPFPARQVRPVVGFPFAQRVQVVASGAISENDIVIANGRVGQRMQVVRADADAVLTARGQLWVAAHAAADAALLVVVPWRFVTGIDTSAWAAIGDPVYMSGTAGAAAATEGAFGVQIGECLEVSATTGAYILDPNASYGAGPMVSGTGTLILTVNDDATAAVDQDPALRLLGGDGVAAPNDDLVRYTMRQDSSTEQLYFQVERSRAAGAYARVTPDVSIGFLTETTAGLDAILRFNAATDAAAARRATLSYLGQEHALEFASATAALSFGLVGTGVIGAKAAAADANMTVQLTGSRIDLGAGGATAVDSSILRQAANVMESGSGDSFYAVAATLGVRGATGDANPTISLVGDVVSLGAGGASAVDWVLDRTAANVAELGSGDSLYGVGTGALGVRNASLDANAIIDISTNGLRMGAGGVSAVDVTLTRGAADRWDVGSGDSVQFAGGGDILGMDEVAFTDAVANASAAGRIRRNATILTWHDGVAARQIIGGDANLTANGIVYGTAAARVVSLGAATNGQLPIGSTGAAPVLASLTAPAAGITITGGAGTITFALANDLSAYEGLAANGLVARTADGAASARTITATSASIVIANGDGVAGNPGVDTAQNIQTTATPQFTRLGLGAPADAAFLWAVAGTASVGMVSTNAAGQTLTIDAQNAGAGTGTLVLTADETVNIGDAGNPAIGFPGTGAITHAGNPTINFGTGALTVGGTSLATTGALVWTLLDNSATALRIGSVGLTNLITCDTTDATEVVAITGRLTTTDRVASGTARIVGGQAASVVAESAARTGAVADFSNGTYAVPANSFRVGSAFIFHALVRVSAVSGAPTGQVILAFGAGSTVVFDTTARTVADEDLISLRGILSCRAVGAAGTLTGFVQYSIGQPDALASAAAAEFSQDLAGSAAGTWTVTIDTTISETFALRGATDGVGTDLNLEMFHVYMVA